MPSQELRILLAPMTDSEAKGWMRFAENKQLLRQVWDSEFPGLTPFNAGEMLYVFKYNISPYCVYNNHKTFKQFPKGYFTACKNNPCSCFSEMRSAISKEINSNLSPAAREASRLKREQTMVSKYGVDNYFKLPNFLEIQQTTLLDKYGVDRVIDVPGVRENIKETSLRHWGTSHPSQNTEIIARTKATNIERYGHECALHGNGVKEKVEATMLARYGVTNYFYDANNQKKITDDLVKTKGVNNVGQLKLSPGVLAILQDRDQFVALVTGCSYESAAAKLNTSAYTVAAYATKHNCISVMSIGQGSLQQDGISDWLTSLKLSVHTNVRSIIPPKEIDIYLPDFKLGI